ncbi:hypothetical protein ACI65C_003004 [Semiaphis heraclei]
MSVDQSSEFEIKDKSHNSIKNENNIYFDVPLISSVKEEVTSHDDSDHLFPIDKNINNTVLKAEKYTEENCNIKTKIDVINFLQTNSYFKEDPEILNNSFQPYGIVLKKEADDFKLELEYNDKTIIIEKETIGDTVFESEIVIEKNEIQSTLNKEKSNAGYYSNFTDFLKIIHEDVNNKTDQNKCKMKKKNYICDLCHQSFINKQSLIIHMSYHFPNNDNCSNNNSKRVCSKNTKCKQLKKHKKSKTLLCTICGKQFSTQSNCRRHILNHNQHNSKKFKCNFCKNNFTTKYNLRVHIRLHTGDYPYKCDICHLRFYRNDVMLSHRRIHEGNQKTYDCKSCLKQFSHNNSLLRHSKIHRVKNKYSCHHCQRSYIRKDSLIVHLRSKHTGEKPYQCHICKKEFYENNVLVRHMMTHQNKLKV